MPGGLRRNVSARRASTPHHAVIPNVNTIDKLREVWPRLSSDEKKLLDVIARAYLAALMPDFRYRQTTATLDVRGFEFRAAGRQPIDLGWRAAFGFMLLSRFVILRAIMCAEAVWWRCDRRIISDYLIAAGETVFDILAQWRRAGAHDGPSQPGPAASSPAGPRRRSSSILQNLIFGTHRRRVRLDIKAVAHAFHVGIPGEIALIGLDLDLPCAL